MRALDAVVTVACLTAVLDAVVAAVCLTVVLMAVVTVLCLAAEPSYQLWTKNDSAKPWRNYVRFVKTQLILAEISGIELWEHEDTTHC